MIVLFRQMVACARNDGYFATYLTIAIAACLLSILWPPAILAHIALTLGLPAVFSKRLLSFLRRTKPEEIAIYATRMNKKTVLGLEQDPTTLILLWVGIIFLVSKLFDLGYSFAGQDLRAWPILSGIIAILLAVCAARVSITKEFHKPAV